MLISVGIQWITKVVMMHQNKSLMTDLTRSTQNDEVERRAAVKTETKRLSARNTQTKTEDLIKRLSAWIVQTKTEVLIVQIIRLDHGWGWNKNGRLNQAVIRPDHANKSGRLDSLDCPPRSCGTRLFAQNIKTKMEDLIKRSSAQIVQTRMEDLIV